MGVRSFSSLCCSFYVWLFLVFCVEGKRSGSVFVRGVGAVILVVACKSSELWMKSGSPARGPTPFHPHRLPDVALLFNMASGPARHGALPLWGRYARTRSDESGSQATQGSPSIRATWTRFLFGVYS